MEELLKQCLLLPKKERKELIRLLVQSVDFWDEDYIIRKQDFTEADLSAVEERCKDVLAEKSCLIFFDDHIVSISHDK